MCSAALRQAGRVSHVCHDAQEPEFGACAAMRTIVCGGEALHPPLVKLFGKLLPQARLYNDYGPTEVTVASTGEPGPARPRHAR